VGADASDIVNGSRDIVVGSRDIVVGSRDIVVGSRDIVVGSPVLRKKVERHLDTVKKPL